MHLFLHSKNIYNFSHKGLFENFLQDFFDRFRSHLKLFHFLRVGIASYLFYGKLQLTFELPKKIKNFRI